MTEKDVFSEMIRNLEDFDQQVLLVLHELKDRQGALKVVTSRFELLGMLRMEFTQDNADKLDETLACLVEAPFYLEGPSGFAIATRAVEGWDQENESERLIVTLGKLFSM